MRRDQRALLVAVVVHAGLLAAITLVSPLPPRERRMGEVQSIELERDLPMTTAPRLAPSTVDPPAPRGMSRAFVAPASAKVTTSEPRGQATTEPLASAKEPDLAADRREELPLGYRVTPNPVALLGLAGVDLAGERNPFLGPPAVGGDQTEKGAERAVRHSLAVRDQALGLGVSGPVVAAAEDVARTSTAEVESHAVLEVVADGEGNVVSASVSDASEDWAGWSAVARRLEEALRGKKVRVAKGSRGIVMTIAIESREDLPSGAAPGVNVSLFDQKVRSGKNQRSATLGILPLVRIPVTIPVPGRAGLTESKTIVLPVPNGTLIESVFDASDFGARAARVVHAHAVSEKEL
jgi:hypothetical protein